MTFAVPDILRQSPAEIQVLAARPLQAGMTVMADSVVSLGKSADTHRHKARCMAVAKFVGGMALPIVATAATKALFALTVRTLLPEAAAVIVPASFFAWSAYQVADNVKQLRAEVKEAQGKYEAKGMSTGRALFKALSSEKFRTGMLVGSAVALVMEATDGLSPLADYIRKHTGSAAPDAAAALNSQFISSSAVDPALADRVHAEVIGKVHEKAVRVADVAVNKIGKRIFKSTSKSFNT